MTDLWIASDWHLGPDSPPTHGRLALAFLDRSESLPLTAATRLTLVAVGKAAAPMAADDPLGALVADIPPLEFAEEDTDKQVRAVPTKGERDIHHQLESLRTMAAGGSGRMAAVKLSKGPTKEVEKRLQDMLVPEKDARLEVRRKASVEVPAKALRNASTVTLQLLLERAGGEPEAYEAVSIKLVGNKKLSRLTLHVELDVKGS